MGITNNCILHSIRQFRSLPYYICFPVQIYDGKFLTQYSIGSVAESFHETVNNYIKRISQLILLLRLQHTNTSRGYYCG